MVTAGLQRPGACTPRHAARPVCLGCQRNNRRHRCAAPVAGVLAATVELRPWCSRKHTRQSSKAPQALATLRQSTQVARQWAATLEGDLRLTPCRACSPCIKRRRAHELRPAAADDDAAAEHQDVKAAKGLAQAATQHRLRGAAQCVTEKRPQAMSTVPSTRCKGQTTCSLLGAICGLVGAGGQAALNGSWAVTTLGLRAGRPACIWMLACSCCACPVPGADAQHPTDLVQLLLQRPPSEAVALGYLGQPRQGGGILARPVGQADAAGATIVAGRHRRHQRTRGCSARFMDCSTCSAVCSCVLSEEQAGTVQGRRRHTPPSGSSSIPSNQAAEAARGHLSCQTRSLGAWAEQRAACAAVGGTIPAWGLLLGRTTTACNSATRGALG